jgi:hypothetical protein
MLAVKLSVLLGECDYVGIGNRRAVGNDGYITAMVCAQAVQEVNHF